MNPLLASPRLVAQHRNDLELEILEQTFEHEAKCQSLHTFTPCSGEVVARKSLSCEPLDFLICDNSKKWNEAVIVNGHVCGYGLLNCRKTCSECWTIRPI